MRGDLPQIHRVGMGQPMAQRRRARGLSRRPRSKGQHAEARRFADEALRRRFRTQGKRGSRFETQNTLAKALRDRFGLDEAQAQYVAGQAVADSPFAGLGGRGKGLGLVPEEHLRKAGQILWEFRRGVEQNWAPEPPKAITRRLAEGQAHVRSVFDDPRATAEERENAAGLEHEMTRWAQHAYVRAKTERSSPVVKAMRQDLQGPSKGWAKKAPDTKASRKALKKRFGSKCFLKPGALKYPVCAKGSGKVSCKALAAARARACQQGDAKVARKALAMAKKYGCGWVAGASKYVCPSKPSMGKWTKTRKRKKRKR